ncbi:CRISPR-associated endonuclease Cas2 [Spiroplasma endosymbiont of Amphibalanus improvisus]|uniref:CRISPR-associated endonuclease Cas2 n=1 Tax=Spiroplasma endosymbiont of Amphibalanus improvisus TaxID=3066327 RepID=UPI00313EECE5
MRLIVMYDLPTQTKSDLQAYSKFHRQLLNNGYVMIQYSVYAKLCMNYDIVAKNIKKLELHKPSKGNVRILSVTEKQYEAMKLLTGEKNWDEENEKIDFVMEL